MLDLCKMVEKQFEAFDTFLRHFSNFKNIIFIPYHSSKESWRPDCIFEIHQQLWQSGFSRVYSNCCCSCSFETEMIKIGQSSHKMYSNNLANFQESTTIVNACIKKQGKFLNSSRKCVVLLISLSVTYSQLTVCAKWIYNVHYYRIYKEHRNLGIRKHVTTSCSGTKPFY